MIKKIKDLSKVKLLKDHVMLMATVDVKKDDKKVNIILPESIKKEDKDDLEKVEILKIEVVAKGIDVKEFEVGDLVSLKSNKLTLNHEVYDSVESLEKRVFVISAYNIDYAVSSNNHEL